MRILSRIGLRFGLIFTVMAVISLFAKDSHKVQEILLFGSVAAVGWALHLATRNR